MPNITYIYLCNAEKYVTRITFSYTDKFDYNYNFHFAAFVFVDPIFVVHIIGLKQELYRASSFRFETNIELAESVK